VRAAAAAEAPPAQQIRIKLKSARPLCLLRKERSARPWMCKRMGATTWPAEWPVRCAGYEKENLAEAVEQVRGPTSHARLGMPGAERRTQAACVAGCWLRALRAAAGRERCKAEPERADAQIKSAASSTGARASGPVFLPTRRAPRSLRHPERPQRLHCQARLRAPRGRRRRIYCVLRSPHVNKDSREHFETRTHQRLLDLTDLTAQTIDELMKLDLPAGVDVEVKL